MTVKEIRESIGISRAEFSRRYRIPLRTIENWEYGKTNPPEWTVEMIRKVVEMDKKESIKFQFDEAVKYVSDLRSKYGKEIVTDPVVGNDGVVRYTIQPDDEIQGTMFEIRYDGAGRHKGIGNGCVWTEWR